MTEGREKGVGLRWTVELQSWVTKNKKRGKRRSREKHDGKNRRGRAGDKGR